MPNRSAASTLAPVAPPAVVSAPAWRSVSIVVDATTAAATASPITRTFVVNSDHPRTQTAHGGKGNDSPPHHHRALSIVNGPQPHERASFPTFLRTALCLPEGRVKWPAGPWRLAIVGPRQA